VPSKSAGKTDRPGVGIDAAAAAARLARPLKHAQSLVSPGSAEGANLLPAPWPMFPYGHSTPQASTAASARAGDDGMELRPATAADTQDVRHGSQEVLRCKDAVIYGWQQRSRGVLSSDGSLGSFMRAEVAARVHPWLTPPPNADREHGRGLALSEPLQTDLDADVSPSQSTSVKDCSRDPTLAPVGRDSSSGAELEVAATADTHSAATVGRLSEETAPRARTEQCHPSAHAAAPLSGEAEHRATTQQQTVDAGAAAELQDRPAGGSRVPVSSPAALHGADSSAVRQGTHPTSSAPTATGEGELSKSVNAALMLRVLSESIQADCWGYAGWANPHMEEMLPDQLSATESSPWGGMAGLLQFLDADDVRLDPDPDPNPDSDTELT